MKLLITILTFQLVNVFSLYSQETNSFIEHVNNFLEVDKNSIINDNYLLYRAKNSFTLIELNDSKINDYNILNSIEYKNLPSEDFSTITPENFIILFSQNSINQLLLNIKRDRLTNTYYRLGSTNFVLVGN